MKTASIQLACAILLATSAAFAQTGQTVTWSGGNDYRSWSVATNWNPQVVPLNNAGTHFTVIVPDSASLVYDAAGAGAIDALSFGSQSRLALTNGQPLDVLGMALIRGTVNARGPGSAFRALTASSSLSSYPSLVAQDGGYVGIGASTYNWAQYNGNATLLQSAGSGSLLELTNVSSLYVAAGTGTRTYSIYAWTNGVIDLSGLGQITGPGDDDWLDLNINSGGDIRLGALGRISGRVRFNLDLPYYELPLLNQATDTHLTVVASNTLSLPLLGSFASGTISVGTNGVVSAPALLTLDTVTVNLSGDGAFVATNLSTYRNSSIAFSPTGQALLGPLNNIYASRLAVSGGATGRVAATSYNMFEDWRSSLTIFSANGTGSRLDLSSLQSITAWGGWSGARIYSITTDNNGVIDLSGLTAATGCRTDAYDNDDWLEFNIRNGGEIKLPALRTLTRKTRWNVEVPFLRLPALENVDNAQFYVSSSGRLELPAAQSVSDTYFSIPDGAAVDAPQLGHASGSSFGWGFNSTFNAPNLVTFQDSELGVSLGRNINVPLFQNIYASRISVSDGLSFAVAATGYDMHQDWRSSLTIFSANGTGSRLDLSSLQSITAWGGWSGARIYSITTDNNGVIDLSGLTAATGCRTDAYDNDDWLEFNTLNSGIMRIGSPSTTRRVRFTAAGNGTELECIDPYLRAPATLAVSGQATLRCKGDFRYENTDPNSITVENAYFQMDGAESQWLEVGGRDSGPGGFTSRNFGCSQLIVGGSNQTSVVRLVDSINNGQRGAAGESEALYLYGMDGQGLRVLNGSRFLLNGLNAYAAVNGQMKSLRSLIPPGTNSVPFDAGFIADFGGPRITNMTPSAAVTPSVGSVDIAFDLPIDPASFTPADVSLIGPDGVIPATSVAPVGANWRISFSPQAADGTYAVRIGPDINELGSTLSGLDQDSDGSSGEAEDDVFTGTFVIDGTAPVVVGAYALQNGTRVGITFDEPVAPAFATNLASYAVNGFAPTQAVLKTNGNQVWLVASPLAGDRFALALHNVVDALGNQTSCIHTGTVLSLAAADIGVPGTDPREPGMTVPFDDTAFDMVAGGTTIGGVQDAGHFAYENRAGDFDVAVRVAAQTTPNQNSQSGLMARPALARNSRFIFVYLQSHSSANRYGVSYRPSDGVSAAGWPGSSNTAGVFLPNAWMRLRRQGDVFTAYRSADGVDWLPMGTLTQTMPATLLVGMAGSANNNAGQTSTSWHRDYADVSPSLLTQPQSQSAASGADVTFAVTARGLPMLTYQWQLNGVSLPAETNSSLTLLAVTTQRAGSYRVLVSNDYGTAASQEAQLVVDDVGLGGFEADVSPAPLGNNAVTVSDWVKVGRLVAGLDVPLNSHEFARADCAPRTNAILGILPLGDSRLSVADWTQAGRYAAAVDPLTPAGGPMAPSAPAPAPGFNAGALLARAAASSSSAARSIRLTGAKVVQGQTFHVSAELEALGGENAVGFSVQFDPARLTYQGIALAEDAADVSLQVNANQAGSGIVGVVLAKSFGQAFPAGTASLAHLDFRAAGGTGSTTLDFGDSPVWREVSDAQADVQPADYVAGAVRVVAPGRFGADVRLDGGTVELRLTGEPGERYRVEVSTDLLHWSPVDEAAADLAPIVVRDSVAGEAHRFYRAALVP